MLIVKTASGSTYHFDNENLTWHRENKNPGHETIMFHEEANSGKLATPVEPTVGKGLTFFEPDDNWVRTTEVVSIEEV